MAIQTESKEKKYRAIACDSYSTLKDYYDSPFGYYKIHITGEKKKEKSKDMILGSLVDCLLLCPDEFDHNFVLGAVSELDKDANQMNYLCHILWKKTQESMNEEGQITREFTVLFDEAFNDSKYDYNGEEVRFKKKEVAYALERFTGTTLEQWYQQKRLSIGKTLISMQDMENAEKIIETLRTNPNTASIINQETDEKIEVHNQFQIEYTYMGLPMKSMLDKMHINHENKTIQPYDLKCTWEIENFDFNYLKNKYYIQNGVYTEGIWQWAQENLPGYKVLPFKFIVAHSTNQLQPVIWDTIEEDYKMAMMGFHINGRYYMGVLELIEGILWSKSTNIWNTRKLIFENYGVAKLNIAYGD